MIFSKEMSGSNFNSDNSKISAGMNGSGAKITNILSKEFIVETTDSELFNKSAGDAVMKSQFLPALQNGKPIAINLHGRGQRKSLSISSIKQKSSLPRK